MKIITVQRTLNIYLLDGGWWVHWSTFSSLIMWFFFCFICFAFDIPLCGIILWELLMKLKSIYKSMSIKRSEVWTLPLVTRNGLNWDWDSPINIVIQFSKVKILIWENKPKDRIDKFPFPSSRWSLLVQLNIYFLIDDFPSFIHFQSQFSSPTQTENEI